MGISLCQVTVRRYGCIGSGARRQVLERVSDLMFLLDSRTDLTTVQMAQFSFFLAIHSQVPLHISVFVRLYTQILDSLNQTFNPIFSWFALVRFPSA